MQKKKAGAFLNHITNCPKTLVVYMHRFTPKKHTMAREKINIEMQHQFIIL
jgi:hypothetical protein